MKANKLLSCILFVLPSFVFVAASSQEATRAASKLHGASPDRFISASPLIMAAVCREGVVVIAAHTSDEDEPLLYYSAGQEDNESQAFADLPSDFAGPFRIHSVDTYGTTMLACGWRADCDTLVARARSLAVAELQRHGPRDVSMSYMRYLTSEVSLYMSECAVSEGVRALSSVGLLAFPKGPALGNESPLWFLDSTGAYPVRAMCLGGGLDSDSGKAVAQLVQTRMKRRTDFIEMSAEKCLMSLLNLLSSGKEVNSTTQLLKPGTRLEMAFVSSDRKMFERIPFKTVLSLKSS